MKYRGSKILIRLLVAILGIGGSAIGLGREAVAQSLPDIVFVTQLPVSEDFRTIGATFANHLGELASAPRGGDLYIRYSDGSLKNLTAAAGYGMAAEQSTNAIAVRDPVVHWSGRKVLFSMVVGAPSQRYQVRTYRWQLYEISGLRKGEKPQITKVPRQPSNYNNIMPAYASDDTIIFVSDRPRNGETHLYPLVDEYESTVTNTGIWSLNPSSGDLRILDSAPSGDFNPIIDSYGRVVFTRWDHLQRDQQGDRSSNTYGAFDYVSEAPNAARVGRREVFPEPRVFDLERIANVNAHSMNFFVPWEMNQDGSSVESLNHIGRHELAFYFPNTFTNDGNVREFISSQAVRANRRNVIGLFHIRENPLVKGRYVAINAPEFETMGGGQIVEFDAAPNVSAEDIALRDLTHPASASPGSSSSGHSGYSRGAVVLSNGALVASHTSQTGVIQELGSTTNPNPSFKFRLRVMNRSGGYYTPGAFLTGGIRKNISYWNPDVRVTYAGDLWEMQPVELVARPRPPRRLTRVPAPERAVFTDLGVSPGELSWFLNQRDLALVVSRNLTSRDRADRQQPLNLRVPGGVSTIPASGRIYDLGGLQMFSGEAVRAYESPALKGRRMLARPLTAPPRLNSSANMISPGTFRIASDGSFAAIVPARKPLTWQLVDPNGNSVVRERVWVTFKPGEIRVCSSCHGVNKSDQMGRGEPQNPPRALRALLQNLRATGAVK